MRVLSLLFILLSAALLRTPDCAATQRLNKPDIIHTAIHGSPAQLRAKIKAIQANCAWWEKTSFYIDSDIALFLALKRNNIENARVLYQNGAVLTNDYRCYFNDEGIDTLPSGVVSREIQSRARELYTLPENEEKTGEGLDENPIDMVPMFTPEALNLILQYQKDPWCKFGWLKSAVEYGSNGELLSSKKLRAARINIYKKHCKE